jgi:hypothetical protein
MSPYAVLTSAADPEPDVPPPAQPMDEDSASQREAKAARERGAPSKPRLRSLSPLFDEDQDQGRTGGDDLHGRHDDDDEEEEEEEPTPAPRPKPAPPRRVPSRVGGRGNGHASKPTGKAGGAGPTKKQVIGTGKPRGGGAGAGAGKGRPQKGVEGRSQFNRISTSTKITIEERVTHIGQRRQSTGTGTAGDQAAKKGKGQATATAKEKSWFDDDSYSF